MKKNTKKIYLDHAATTPASRGVIEAMLPYFSQYYGNPMSVHSFGQVAQEAVDNSRGTIAKFLGCSTDEIVFTSGATESNNLAIKGVLRSWKSQGKKAKPHFIISAIEHHCVLDTCRFLERDGEIELTVLPVSKDGLVNPADLRKNIKNNTALVSIMYVNNEVGTIQPIVELASIIQSVRLDAKSSYPLFHTDATQAVNYFSCDTWKLGVDLLSFSGHKIYGPKGVGVLFVKKGVPLKRIQDGGDQEYRLRAGTHNVPGIVGIAKAIQEIISKKYQVRNKELSKLRDYLIKKIIKEIPESYLNGSLEFRSPNNINVRFDNVEGEGLILSLDMEGFAVSTGSACSSGALDPSHVLLALGLKHEQAHGSLRITLGKDNSKKELDQLVTALKNIVRRLRSISGSVLSDYHLSNK